MVRNKSSAFVNMWILPEVDSRPLQYSTKRPAAACLYDSELEQWLACSSFRCSSWIVRNSGPALVKLFKRNPGTNRSPGATLGILYFAVGVCKEFSNDLDSNQWSHPSLSFTLTPLFVTPVLEILLVVFCMNGEHNTIWSSEAWLPVGSWGSALPARPDQWEWSALQT